MKERSSWSAMGDDCRITVSAIRDIAHPVNSRCTHHRHLKCFTRDVTSPLQAVNVCLQLLRLLQVASAPWPCRFHAWAAIIITTTGSPPREHRRPVPLDRRAWLATRNTPLPHTCTDIDRSRSNRIGVDKGSWNVGDAVALLFGKGSVACLSPRNTFLHMCYHAEFHAVGRSHWMGTLGSTPFLMGSGWPLKHAPSHCVLACRMWSL